MQSDHQSFDRTLREILQSLPKRFIEVLFGKRVIEILDPTFPSVKDRTVDFAGKLEDGKIVLVEVQGSNDKTLPLRLIDTCLRAFERFQAFPLQIILWISERRCPYKENIRFGPIRHRVKVIDLKKINCKDLLSSPDPNDVLLGMLCKRDRDFWERLKEKLFLLPEEKRGDFLAKLACLVRLRKDLKLEYIKWIKEVKTMPIVIDYEKDPFFKKGMREGKKEGIKLGLQKGIQRGIQQGIQQGTQLEAKKILKDILLEKFGAISDSLAAKIDALEDLKEIEKLIKLTLRIQRLEEFEEALG